MRYRYRGLGVNSMKILIAMQHAMLAEVDQLAVKECRTRSDLIREALRRYLEEARRKNREQSNG